ncbi:MAG: homocysteine S-methyltransferase family protein [Planctomycetota bacterium]|nr:homocysteine S-methyltransferase family protein [Planctomycetota bacterium]
MRVRENGRGGGRHRAWIWGADAMAFNPADYRDRILIAGPDLAAEIISRGWSNPGQIEQAVLVRPELVRDAADVFVDAGAEILLTPTARASGLRPTFSGEPSPDVSSDVVKANQAAAAVLRDSADGGPSGNGLVFGVVGPPPGLLALNEVKRDDLRSAYEAQIKGLADGGADAILCQSFSEIETLNIAVEAAGSACELPLIGCMTFDCGPDRVESSSGVSVPRICSSLSDAGVAAVGCDGGESPDSVPAVVALMRESCDLPIWATVAAGLPDWVEGRLVYAETPQEYGERLSALAAAGATFIGGGGGATPDHIAAMAAARLRHGKRG